MSPTSHDHGAGDESHATEVQQRGSFDFAVCRLCGWIGPGRRSASRARKDGVDHVEEHGGKKKAQAAVVVVRELGLATELPKKPGHKH